ncbi:MAG: hypothetical protein JXA09_04145 [Anaerolineae bacterium]|nr:hypothetical protein [Anaerolineae bacterium]
MSDVVALKDLLPGDVLLYKGTAVISRAIRFFDGTEFSHAALYMGDSQVAEALAKGLVKREYTADVMGDTWVQAHRLKSAPPDMSPVVDTAQAYVDDGNRYGYEQLLLLAFLCMTRKLSFAPSLRRLVRRALDNAAAVLTDLIGAGREPMICSEFVFRAYDEALPEAEDVFTLRISGLEIAPLMGAMAPARLAQGIHPESLLAFLAATPSSAWVSPPAPLAYAEAEVEPERDDAALEEAIEQYLAEVRMGPQGLAELAGAAPPDVTVEDLKAATDRFAVRLYDAMYPEPEAALAAVGGAGALSMATENLLEVAADFVTPGDLFKSPSLFALDRVKV